MPVLDRCGTDPARTEPSDVELRWCNRQRRHPTADPAVFSRVRLIRVRPRGYVGVAFSLISRVGVDSVAPGDPTPFALVRIGGQNVGRIVELGEGLAA